MIPDTARDKARDPATVFFFLDLILLLFWKSLMICYLNACKCTSYRKEKLFVGFHRVLELLVTLAIIVLPCHYKLLGSHFRGENFQVQRYFTSYIRTSVCKVHILFNNITQSCIQRVHMRYVPLIVIMNLLVII